MELHTDAKSRIEAVDALRGFAVMAILLVHNLEHFIFPVYPADSAGWLGTLDQGVSDVVFSLFAGKAYAIFALLFGFTFHIQADRRKREGRDFGYRFLWRLVLLAGFAALNAAFSPRATYCFCSSRSVRCSSSRGAGATERSSPQPWCSCRSPSSGIITSPRWRTRRTGCPTSEWTPCMRKRPNIRKPGISDASSRATSPWARKPVCCGP